MFSVDFLAGTMKDKVAIIVVGYNRILSIKRLLNSLLEAKYANDDIPLIISIDYSGNQELYEFVKSFRWPFGPKYLNIQEERLGLKNHIYKCGDLSKYFRGVILLEDDIVVCPTFYLYVLETLEKYGTDPRIAQISLYKNEMNGYVGYPFDNEQVGNDVFLMQDVSTWGQCWTPAMWEDFVIWRDSHSEDYVQGVDMPEAIKGWTRAWSKYYNAYVVDSCKYILYPNIALTTNFSDAGEHGDANNSIVQVNILQNNIKYRLGEYDDLVKYDIYFNNENLYVWLGISKEDLCLDLYGFNNNILNKRFVLSIRNLPYKILKSYALNMRPIELNVKYDIEGNGIYLYDTSVKVANKINSYPNTVTSFFLKGFNIKFLFRYVFSYYLNSLKNKFFRCK